MEKLRPPFLGVKNIICFNWHFYALALVLIGGLISMKIYAGQNLQVYCTILLVAIAIPVVLSLTISWYVYDVSNLYELPWLGDLKKNSSEKIVNIHAGFDETSFILNEKFKLANLTVYNFYDGTKNNEVSIERANRRKNDFPGTILVKPSELPAKNNYYDKVLITFAAHEIRDKAERVQFFKELKRSLSENGEILVTEHLRDFPNFLAYTIGFFHFYSKGNWKTVFQNAELILSQEIKTTAFVSTFVLKK